MKEAEKNWIEVGYRIFAYDGPSKLKIERISREVSKNKSSFYHFFADLDIFTQRLLDFHLQRAKRIEELEAEAKDEQEFVEILIDHKVDLLFNRQLRFHRENPNFENCFNKINQMTFPAILPLWSKIIGLADNSYLAQMVLSLSIENFYLQITDATLNEQWLKSYFSSIREMILQFQYSKSAPTMDGSV